MNTATPPAAASPPPARQTRSCAAWRTRCARSRWTPSSRRNPAIPACRWAWPTSPTVLFTQFLRFDPQAPDWPDRDRFVLSNGHGSMLLYGLLHLTGYPDMTLDELKRFRQLGSRTAGHPERGLATGIETTTGPLGQGLANSVGMALAERISRPSSATTIVDHHTYVFCGDGCLMEGISHEALVARRPSRPQQADRPVGRQLDLDRRPDRARRFPTTSSMRFRAHGWAAERVDGLDHDAIAAAIRRAADERPAEPDRLPHDHRASARRPRPAPPAAHGSPLGAEEIKGAKERLGWEYGPFVVPDDVRAEWRAAGARGAAVRQRMGTAARRRAGRQARRVPAPHEGRTAGRISTR